MREGVPAKLVNRSIGRWTTSSQSEHAEAQAIGDWAEQSGYEGVVWTALKPKFGNTYTIPTCAQVIAYLNHLSGETRTRAEEYVRRTPPEIRTAYRDQIELALGWVPMSNY
jgi:hypothetical protein